MTSDAWCIVKQPDGHCEIVPASQVDANASPDQETWGPFKSQSEAIARRVGLIRAGKCQPQ